MASHPHPIADLERRLATTATGFGAVIGGVLNVRTVSDSRKSAAMNAVYAMGHSLVSSCADPDCGCLETTLTELFPDVRIVAVKVEVGHD